MGEQKSAHKYNFAAVVMIIGVGMCFFSMVFKNNIWFDESFTINLVRHPIGEILELTALDVHPPLYYIAVKIFTAVFGWNNLALYAPSILSFIALLTISFWFFSKYFSQKTAMFVIAVFCAAPNMMKYAMQLRMYSMAMLWVTCAFYLVHILCVQLQNGNKKWSRNWVLLAVFNVLAAYTHYFAGVAAAAISLFLLGYVVVKKGVYKRQALIHWCIHCGLMIVFYLPWIPVLFRQMSAVNQDYWITPITEGALHAYPEILFWVPDEQMRLLLTAIYLIGFCLVVLQFGRNIKDYWVYGCYAVVLIWFAFGIGYSVVGSPILTERYMVILLPLLWIPVCVSYSKTIYKYVSMAVLFVLVICFIQNYEILYNEYAMNFQNEMVAYIKEQKKEDDVFFHTYIQDLSLCSAYFAEAEQYTFIGADDEQVFHYWQELTDCQMVEKLDELSDIKGDIWAVNAEWLSEFVKLGWKIEPVQLVSGAVYRLYR